MTDQRSQMVQVYVFLRINQGGVPYAEREKQAREIGRLLCKHPYLANSDFIPWCDPHMVTERVTKSMKNNPIEETIVMCDLYGNFIAGDGCILREYFHAKNGGVAVIKKMIETDTPETYGCVIHWIGEPIIVERDPALATFTIEYPFSEEYANAVAAPAPAASVAPGKGKRGDRLEKEKSPEWDSMFTWHGPR